MNSFIICVCVCQRPLLHTSCIIGTYYTMYIFLLAPQVTLLHVESDQELMSSHSFRVDSSVKNVTLHVTGILTECILTSPSGMAKV